MDLQQLQEGVTNAVAVLEESAVNKQIADGEYFNAGLPLAEKLQTDEEYNAALTALANAQADVTAALVAKATP